MDSDCVAESECSDGPPRKKLKDKKSLTMRSYTGDSVSSLVGKTTAASCLALPTGDGSSQSNEGLLLFTPPAIEEEKLWPFTKKDFVEIAQQEQQKLSGLAKYAATYVFERYRYISKEQIRHIERLANTPLSAIQYDLHKVPFPRQIGLGDREFFCGRKSDLENLANYFLTNAKEGKPTVQVICGFGGLGKTQLSYEYAHRYRTNYPGGVLLFDLQTQTIFHDSIKENLVILGIKPLPSAKASLDFEELQAKIRELPKFLFIYDGADKLSSFVSYIPSLEVDLIITTRSANIDARLRGYKSFSLKVLDVPTSVQVLVSGSFDVSDRDFSAESYQTKYPRDYCYAEKIAGKECLDGLPLALLHAASYRRHQGPTFTFEDFWKKLQEGKGNLPLDLTDLKAWLKNYNLKRIGPKLNKLHIEDMDDLRQLSSRKLSNSDLDEEDKRELLKAKEELLTAPAYITWRLDIDSSCEVAPLAENILCVAATLPSNDIPESLLFACAEIMDKTIDKTEVGDAIHHILSRSLFVRVMDDEVGCPRTFSMHTMIQYSVTKHLMPGQERLDVILSCVGQALCEKLPTAPEFRKELRLSDSPVKMYSVHLFHLAAIIAESKRPLAGRWQQEALSLACILSIRLSNAQVGFPLCRKQLEEARRAGIKETICYALIELGRCHSILLETESAVALFEEAEVILGPLPCTGEMAEWWGEGLFEIIRGLRQLNLLKRIQVMAKQMRSGLERANVTKCQCYAQCLNAIAAVSSTKAGDAAEMDKLSFKALEVYKEALPKDHPNIATELMNIGFRRCEQGNYPEADKFLMESVEMFRKVLPAENWETAYSLGLLGLVYLEWGRNEEAGRNLAEALDVVNNSSCMTYVTLFTLQALAIWQAVVGRTREAEQNQTKALKIMEDITGNDKEARAKAIFRACRCWVSLGRYQEAEKSLRDARNLLCDIPEDHYLLMDVQALLGQCLVAQNKTVEAQSILKRLLDVRNDIEPKDTPPRGAVLHYLGVCLLNQSKCTEAEALLREALDIRENCLVENDVRTASSSYQLGRCIFLLGRHEEAMSLIRNPLLLAKLRAEKQ